MARHYRAKKANQLIDENIAKSLNSVIISLLVMFALSFTSIPYKIPPIILVAFALIPVFFIGNLTKSYLEKIWLRKEKNKESSLRGGKEILGLPPKRDCFQKALQDAQKRGKTVLDKYLVGFELESGEPLWLDEEDICSHACVFAKTGVGKTLWLESLIFQQMARGRASGCTFIDAKRDSSTLAQVILMASATGRLEDLIVVDPFDPVHAYNFVHTTQRSDVKARKVLRAGLPPTSDKSTTKHYDRLAMDSIYRMVRALESLGLSWSIHDVAVSLSTFHLAYPHIKSMLEQIGAEDAMVELGHLASSYRSSKGSLDAQKITDNLRGIASELHAISGSSMGEVFCTNYTDLNLTDAMLRGKIIYFMLPRLEEAESAQRMIKLFREDLEVSIGEITSSREFHLEDPHLVMIDEGSSTFGPTWANLFELARKGRFALLFGAQSTGGLTDESLGLSQAFYERVMANVNLKVMMRVGDNRTAFDMAEWFGKVSTVKKSYGSGITTGSSTSSLAGPIDLNARTSGGESQSINISETEDYIVSPEELKHEMSAEKGLAWFDMGDGKITKGRCFWFNAEIPDTWEGRNLLVKHENAERDSVGLGSWVDRQILSEEMAKVSKDSNIDDSLKKSSSSKMSKNDTEEDTSPFKLDLNDKNRNRGNVMALENSEKNLNQDNKGSAKKNTKKFFPKK